MDNIIVFRSGKFFLLHGAEEIEVENPDILIKEDANRVKFFMDHCLLSQLKENETIKWEGTAEECYFKKVSETWIMCMKSEYKDNEDYRKRARLIAPVKEGPEYVHLTEKDKAFIDLMKVPDSSFQSKPVPSEQENQEDDVTFTVDDMHKCFEMGCRFGRETMSKKKIRLHWLKVGDDILYGDYCWDQRGKPVSVIGGHKISKTHHPHFRIIDHERRTKKE